MRCYIHFELRFLKTVIFLFLASASTAGSQTSRGESSSHQGVGNEQTKRARRTESAASRTEHQVQSAARVATESHRKYSGTSDTVC